MTDRTDWDARANTYDTLGWVHGDGLDWTARLAIGAIQEAIERTGVNRVLEVGCGTGALTERLANEGYCLHAVDVSERMIARARERVGTRVGQVGYYRIDADDSLPPWDYAAIVSRMVLHHAPCEPGEQIARWAPILPPGGALIVAEGPPPTTDDRHDAVHLYRAAMALKEPGRHVLHAYQVAEWMLDAGCVEVRVDERWTEGNSVRNWLAGGGIEPARAEAILALHREASPTARKVYRIEETADGDVLMRWRTCVVSGIRA